MSYLTTNYLKDNSPESKVWHMYLNREDMDHDAEPLLKKDNQ